MGRTDISTDGYHRYLIGGLHVAGITLLAISMFATPSGSHLPLATNGHQHIGILTVEGCGQNDVCWGSEGTSQKVKVLLIVTNAVALFGSVLALHSTTITNQLVASSILVKLSHIFSAFASIALSTAIFILLGNVGYSSIGPGVSFTFSSSVVEVVASFVVGVISVQRLTPIETKVSERDEAIARQGWDIQVFGRNYEVEVMGRRLSVSQRSPVRPRPPSPSLTTRFGDNEKRLTIGQIVPSQKSKRLLAPLPPLPGSVNPEGGDILANGLASLSKGATIQIKGVPETRRKVDASAARKEKLPSPERDPSKRSDPQTSPTLRSIFIQSLRPFDRSQKVTFDDTKSSLPQSTRVPKDDIRSSHKCSPSASQKVGPIDIKATSQSTGQRQPLRTVQEAHSLPKAGQIPQRRPGHAKNNSNDKASISTGQPIVAPQTSIASTSAQPIPTVPVRRPSVKREPEVPAPQSSSSSRPPLRTVQEARSLPKAEQVPPRRPVHAKNNSNDKAAISTSQPIVAPQASPTSTSAQPVPSVPVRRPSVKREPEVPIPQSSSASSDGASRTRHVAEKSTDEPKVKTLAQERPALDRKDSSAHRRLASAPIVEPSPVKIPFEKPNSPSHSSLHHDDEPTRSPSTPPMLPPDLTSSIAMDDVFAALATASRLLSSDPITLADVDQGVVLAPVKAPASPSIKSDYSTGSDGVLGPGGRPISVPTSEASQESLLRGIERMKRAGAPKRSPGDLSTW